METADAATPDGALFAAALALDPQRRGELAAELLKSLDDVPPSQRRSPEQWRAEIDRRVESAVNGDSPGVSYDEAVSRIRAAASGE